MDQNGTVERKPVNVIPFGPGEAHLQNKIESYRCHLCNKDGEEMVLLYKEAKLMVFACLEHRGVIQEFVKQFKRLPLGYKQESIKGVQCEVGQKVGQAEA